MLFKTRITINHSQIVSRFLWKFVFRSNARCTNHTGTLHTLVNLSDFPQHIPALKKWYFASSSRARYTYFFGKYLSAVNMALITLIYNDFDMTHAIKVIPVRLFWLWPHLGLFYITDSDKSSFSLLFSPFSPGLFAKIPPILRVFPYHLRH